MRRVYPESGPERRAREEAYGQGTHEVTKCRKCGNPFSSEDVKNGLNVMQRNVSGGYIGPYTGIDGVPLRINDSGGLCSNCQ